VRAVAGDKRYSERDLWPARWLPLFADGARGRALTSVLWAVKASEAEHALKWLPFVAAVLPRRRAADAVPTIPFGASLSLCARIAAFSTSQQANSLFFSDVEAQADR